MLFVQVILFRKPWRYFCNRARRAYPNRLAKWLYDELPGP